MGIAEACNALGLHGRGMSFQRRYTQRKYALDTNMGGQRRQQLTLCDLHVQTDSIGVHHRSEKAFDLASTARAVADVRQYVAAGGGVCGR